MSKMLFSAMLFAIAGAATPAFATVKLVTSATDDLAFEGLNGFLQTRYRLPNPASGNTVLPPLERAVGEVRIGRPSTNAERTRGFHVPNAGSGIPGVGAGVTSALTNFSPLSTLAPVSGNVTKNWFTPYSSTAATLNDSGFVDFSIGRTGTTVFYTVGTDRWQDSQPYYADINGFEFRLASQASRVDSIALNNVTYFNARNTPQLLGSFSAADGARLINLYDNIGGDFRITGQYRLQVKGQLPGASGLASQFKLLALPAVPEPATWALMIAGFGLVGVSLRRRRIATPA